MFTSEHTYFALLIVQACHLLHHRLAKRHISFAEVISAIVLCIPPRASAFSGLLMGLHLILMAIQIIGSLWIKRLSPDWSTSHKVG
jgi:hypothetical protein